MPSTDHLGRATGPELASRLTGTEAGGATLLIPLGATEQHGPHLPLATDSMIATAWADLTAAGLEAVGARAVVAPTLPYGSSGEHQDFVGTLSIGQEALTSVLIELTRSAASSFKRIVFLSGHAGNLEPVGRAAAQLVAEGHDVHQFFPSWPKSAGFAIDAHAGRTETSIVLHLAPDAVRTDRLVVGDDRPISDVLPLLRSGGVAAVSATGVLGNPIDATADEGAKLLASLVDATVAALTE